MHSDYVSKWKQELAPIINRRGRKAELARWLSDHLGSPVQARKIQVAKIFNGNISPRADFILCVQDWIKTRAFMPNGKRDEIVVRREMYSSK